MAERYGPQEGMRLRLQKADSTVQLVGHRQLLVLGGQASDEGAVVGADKGYIRVRAATQSSIAITNKTGRSGQRSEGNERRQK